MLERPDLLANLVTKHTAKDGTVRATAMAELNAMQVRPSQYNPAGAVPEKSWAYWIAKKLFFNDFAVYDGRDHSAKSAPSLLGRLEVGVVEATGPNLVQLEVRNGTH